eukprot:TRINITY_DN4026_c0_g1_i2.p1 TRINITY_DN4026_c0_g1~~TRINITY_DN4026_c0_g1_i2.p1  ORF type:complete len:183 (-),score=50.89 TRINITY_DN4026_c0_g1_i2:141-689(-)
MSSNALTKSMLLLNELKDQLNASKTGAFSGSGVLSGAENTLDVLKTSSLNTKKSTVIEQKGSPSFRRTDNEDELVRSPTRLNGDEDFAVIDIILRKNNDRCDELKRRIERDMETFNKECDQIQTRLSEMLSNMKSVLYGSDEKENNAETGLSDKYTSPAKRTRETSASTRKSGGRREVAFEN